MDNSDIILEYLEENRSSEYCDDCISSQLGIKPRAQVNQICNRLSGQGTIKREKGLCALCRKRKLVNAFDQSLADTSDENDSASNSQEETPELLFVHTSPDFPDTIYDAKVTSIKDAIAAMLQRARCSIRISTRQMDMFDDELIRLKQDSPDLEITVLSRGPEKAEGARKKIAGRAFDRMKAVGIKLPIEQDLLHSRMVVVDDQELLVSSADLDYTQMEKEFNSGIWTNNPSMVAEATKFFDNLLRSPTVKQ